MRHLARVLGSIEPLLAGKAIFLFLDYDGTLVPIKKKPALATMSRRARELLRVLSKDPECKVAIISGRSSKEVSRLVALRSIIYAGNHGLEIKGPQLRFKSPVSTRQANAIKEIARELHTTLAPVKGVLIENKGLSLGIHYRLVPARKIPLAKDIFCRAIAFHPWRNQIQVHTGKMVFEVRPSVRWDKGKAVLWLLRNTPVQGDAPLLPIYIGDDRTDEDAFNVLKDRGLSIFVGRPRRSFAQYYLQNTREVLDFLSWILKHKGARCSDSRRRRLVMGR